MTRLQEALVRHFREYGASELTGNDVADEIASFAQPSDATNIDLERLARAIDASDINSEVQSGAEMAEIIAAEYALADAPADLQPRVSVEPPPDGIA